MQSKVCILGGKPMEKIVLEYSKNFDTRVRVNCNVQGDIDLEKDQFYLNNHVYNNFVKTNKSLEMIKNLYKYTNKGILEKMFSVIKKVIKKPLQQKESGKNTFSNNMLKNIGCKNLFKKAPRCGYQAIMYYLELGFRPVVSGFTIKDNEVQVTEGNTKKIGIWHEVSSEIKVIKELFLMNKIDITPCMIEPFSLPLLDCIHLQPKKHFIDYCLQKTGICIIKNYFSNEILSKIITEYDRVFKTKKDSIEILDKEDCSNDERIFHAERYSQYIKKHFSDEPLFNSIAKNYRTNLNKKTLINKIQYEEGKIKNSGAGWHRDNHNCQFKAIMYLTDVGSKSGNFRFITNSSKKHIGFPKPRTESYNTRFTNKTIEALVENNSKCDIIDIIGDKGTIILADTTYIHRGKIIEEGVRKAITQYFF